MDATVVADAVCASSLTVSLGCSDRRHQQSRLMDPNGVEPATAVVTTAPWTVLVCGERNRGDDGAAVAAVERLPRRLRSAIRIRACGQLEPDELLSALLSGPCLILDTVRSVAPGAILEVGLRQLLSGDGSTPASTRALRMPIVVGLAAELGAPLECGAFLGIGGSTFGPGERLSPAVEAGLDGYVATIVLHLRARGRPRRG